MKCIYCGNEISEGESFCRFCGSAQNVVPAFENGFSEIKPAPGKKGGKGALIAVIAVLAVLLLGIAAVFILDMTEVINVKEMLGIEQEEDTKKDRIEKEDNNKDEEKDTSEEESSSEDEDVTKAPVDSDPDGYSDIKIGFILLHDENSTYDLNFLNAVDKMKKNLGLSDEQIVVRTNVPESNDCYDAATELAEWGCDIVFANSFGHEDFMIKAAKENPDVEFIHATGTKAHTEGLANFHNVYASVYEGWYLTGIAAGMKLNEMIENGEISADEAKMGFIGTFTYAEVISAYSAFYLGAKSVCPTVTMDVQFTGVWYHEQLEKEAAEALIAKDCVLISQYPDSLGAPMVCENAGVPNITYNGSTQAACPETYLITTRIDWTPCFEYLVTQYAESEEIATDWCGSIEDGSICVNEINYDVAAEGTIDKIEETAIEIMNGTVQVFDTSTFTVNGETLDSHMADVDSDALFSPDTEVISDGAFLESEYRSAPYFDLRIDGITLLNELF